MTLFFFLVLILFLFLFPFGFDNPVVLQGTTNCDFEEAALVSCSGQLGLWASFPFVQVIFLVVRVVSSFRKFLSLWRV